MELDFPYGKTEITVEEYEGQIDAEEIADHLAEGTTGDPAPRVESFIYTMPQFLDWLDSSGRDYPWRHTTDPWRVYATEILLQRTRADAVANIYEGFFDRFPSPNALMKSNDEMIYTQIKSLGFGNQRTRSLKEAAELCVTQYDGTVPADLDALQQPWRVGPYSARACLLFAFNQPISLVDSNIARIIERVFGYQMPNQPHKKDSVYELVDTLIPDTPELARSITFAFLDLGALICTEPHPKCNECPLNSCCLFTEPL
ncbi:A/G-specific DNA-adenine glycosylase [Natronorubrum sediminis]|uniref:A/G-specific DNA-adenine glycosylase n=1 Tax=Natronorubrum sediminis TaxID=640943 RepID=A0A1H6FYE4_9EURY|nr:hypothetical protein [Natronorubrum sediminis]SEH15023.1 A/G-specific DNA-adenine glycosylase [Natronorubrum sediminis]